MPVGHLYITESRLDDILYVGQSSKMDSHSIATYLGSGDYFSHAVAEHGAHNFSKKVIDYFDDQAELDYAEVYTIARLRAEGRILHNGGVGGPRSQREFVGAMLDRFGVLPQMRDEWLQAVHENHHEVRGMIAAGYEVSADDFYRELEAQLQQTQDLSGGCPRCGADVGAVCRTNTGNPSRNHARRPVNA